MHELAQEHIAFLALKRHAESFGTRALHAGPDRLGFGVLEGPLVRALPMADTTEKCLDGGDALEEDMVEGLLVGFVWETSPVDGLAAVPAEDDPLAWDL